MFSKTHIGYIDSIRGLAALTVISEHFVIAYGLPCQNHYCQQLLEFSPLSFWWDGGAAVSMFFVLSGFVLSIKYFRDGHYPDLNNFNLLQYTIARLFRIWLPYCAILLLSAWLYLQNSANDMPVTRLPASSWLIDLWHNYHLSIMDMLRESFLLQLPPTIVLLPQAWTLTIELVLSLLLPLGLLLVEKGVFWLIFFALIAVGFLGVSVFLMHFLMGLLIARYYLAITQYLSQSRFKRRLLLLLGILFYTSASFMPELNDFEKIVWFRSGLGASLILMFALSSPRCQNALSHPLLRQIGKVSYSAYLIHMLILICVTPQLLTLLELLTEQRLLLWIAAWLLTIVIVQLLSLACYHWLETPCMSLGKKLIQYIDKVERVGYQ